MIRASDFAALTTELQDIFSEASADSISESKGMSIFDVSETELLDFKKQVLHGVSGIEEVADGADLPKVGGEEGDSITYTQRYFGAIVEITKKLRKFDRYDEIRDLVESITQDAWDKVDQSLADVLLNGWATSYTDVYNKVISSVGPDGLALFSAAHTYGNGSAKTYSNIISDGTNTNPALSRAALVNVIKTGRTFKDSNNLSRPIHFDTIVVPPSLEDLALRIVNSKEISGSSNYDPNMLVRNRFKDRVVVWDRLEQTGQGVSKAAHWFVYDSKRVKKSLVAKFAERPSLDAPEQVYDNKNWDYSIDYFYTTGLGLQKYVMGSKGDNS